jgi:two-component system chemotaxis sensor kinase CheA
LSQNDDIVNAFLEEGNEGLNLAERLLVELEARPDDVELLRQLYRTIHTIKGTCGFLGFPRLETLTHAGEDLLDALRSGAIALDTGITSSLLVLVDTIRAAFGRIEATGSEGESLEDEHVIADLVSQLQGGGGIEASHAEAESAETAPAESASTVRVDVTVLDKLMDLVGELVLTRNQLGDLVAEAEGEGPLVSPHRQLTRLSNELQEYVMRARLQPIGTVTGKFPRLARDLADNLGKQVRVDLSGEDVGADRAVNDALKEILTHLVRNSIDHGIESPDVRVAAGKDPEGCLRIGASYGGGRIEIDVSDDGAGIDTSALISTAIAAGRITQDEASALTHEKALQLMFIAGVSTKSEVTKVSGRGVGMDAVRASLDKLNASISIDSEIGHGTTYRINVPLSLTIVDAVIVRSGGQRFALPQLHVHEALGLVGEELEHPIDDVDGVKLLRLRGDLLPLLRMDEAFGMAPTESRDDSINVVVADLDGSRFGLVVDEVEDTMEVVVKPMTYATRGLQVFAGVTILSDGAPTLIVDLAGVAKNAGLELARRETTSAQTPRKVEQVGEEMSLLLAAAGGQPFAVPLAAIWRLEQIARHRVEQSGELQVMQYGDSILPLISVAELLPDAPTDEGLHINPLSDQISAIVCRTTAGPVGLIVESIDDVVPEPSTPGQPSTRAGVLSRIVVGDQVTELIDVEVLVSNSVVGKAA